MEKKLKGSFLTGSIILTALSIKFFKLYVKLLNFPVTSRLYWKFLLWIGEHPKITLCKSGSVVLIRSMYEICFVRSKKKNLKEIGLHNLWTHPKRKFKIWKIFSAFFLILISCPIFFTRKLQNINKTELATKKAKSRNRNITFWSDFLLSSPSVLLSASQSLNRKN